MRKNCIKLRYFWFILYISGRSRHGRFRDDMAGIGSFMKETRTLYLSDFCMPAGD